MLSNPTRAVYGVFFARSPTLLHSHTIVFLIGSHEARKVHKALIGTEIIPDQRIHTQLAEGIERYASSFIRVEQGTYLHSREFFGLLLKHPRGYGAVGDGRHEPGSILSGRISIYILLYVSKTPHLIPDR